MSRPRGARAPFPAHGRRESSLGGAASDSDSLALVGRLAQLAIVGVAAHAAVTRCSFAAHAARFTAAGHLPRARARHAADRRHARSATLYGVLTRPHAAA